MYWRLSGFYFFYFAALGALVPYWSLYLYDLGFDAVAIGELIAIIMGTKLVAPYIWGWIADHSGRRMRIIRLASLLTAVTFAGVLLVNDYWRLAAVMLAFSFFWNAALPQFEAETLNRLGSDTHRYSMIRMWGSIGFIVVVAALGPVLDTYGVTVLPWVLLALFTGIWLSSLLVAEQKGGTVPADHEPILRVILRPAVLSLLGVCFLLQASHGVYYTFFTIYMEDVGYSRGAIGQLWALGVIAEIGVFLVMHRWLPRFGARNLLLISLALTSVRWLLLAGYADVWWLVLFAQTLHAASFGVYHAVSIHLVHQYFVGRHQGRGQALYSSLSFGAGGAVGSLLSGHLWDSVGAQLTFTLAAAVSTLALALAYAGVRGREADSSVAAP